MEYLEALKNISSSTNDITKEQLINISNSYITLPFVILSLSFTFLISLFIGLIFIEGSKSKWKIFWIWFSTLILTIIFLLFTIVFNTNSTYDFTENIREWFK